MSALINLFNLIEMFNWTYLYTKIEVHQTGVIRKLNNDDRISIANGIVFMCSCVYSRGGKGLLLFFFCRKLVNLL